MPIPLSDMSMDALRRELRLAVSRKDAKRTAAIKFQLARKRAASNQVVEPRRSPTVNPRLFNALFMIAGHFALGMIVGVAYFHH